eukprot:IDg5698t1
MPSGIGAREPVSWAEGIFKVQDGQPKYTSATHSCFKRAVIDAVFALHGGGTADVVQKCIDSDTRIYTSFKFLGGVLQKTKESVIGCRVVRNDDVQRSIRPMIEWRLSGQLHRRLAESTVLEHCVGENASNIRVTEVREFKRSWVDNNPVDTASRKAFWFIDLVSPSAIFIELRTKPISEITLSRKPLRAAAISSIVRFSDVRESFKMISKSGFVVQEIYSLGNDALRDTTTKENSNLN